VGDGLLTMSRISDALRLNRVIGLGHRGQATDAMIGHIIDRARAAKLRRVGLLMSPGPQSETITRWILARGFRRHGGIALLVRDGRRDVPPPRAKVRVRRASRRDGDAIIDIQERCFGSPASRRAWAMAALAIPGTEHYLAWTGREPVGAGALRIDGDLAWLGGGATLTPWRRHGAHAALIAARLRRAARRGCRWAWVETGEPVPGRPSGSFRNLLRMGFEPVAVKPSYVWRNPAVRRRR
jgi:GNAT superfamily N-acetyltransferase